MKPTAQKVWHLALAWLSKHLPIAAVLSVFVCAPVLAEVINLTYSPATTWGDGTPLDIRSTRLICNGVQVDGHPGATGTFNPDLADGTYACHAVHTAFVLPGNVQCSIVDASLPDVCISDPSNTKQFIVGSTIIITVGSPTQLEVVQP